MRVLVDSGSIGNYIDAQECVGRGIKIEVEDQAEELKMQMILWSRQRDESRSCSSVVGTEAKFLPVFFLT